MFLLLRYDTYLLVLYTRFAIRILLRQDCFRLYKK